MAHEFEPGVVRRTGMPDTVELDAIRDDAPVCPIGVAGRIRQLARDHALVVRHGDLGRAALAVLASRTYLSTGFIVMTFCAKSARAPDPAMNTPSSQN